MENILTTFPNTHRATLSLMDDDGTAAMVHHFQHIPTRQEVVDTIHAHVNALTDRKILTGFQWQGHHVYLSTENQFNFKAAYDLAVQTAGATLPVTFKLGEDPDTATPTYFTFQDMQTFTHFYTSAIAFINQALNDGWQQKDAATEWAQSLHLP